MIYTIKKLFPNVRHSHEKLYKGLSRGLLTVCECVKKVCDVDEVEIFDALDVVESWENSMSLFFKVRKDFEDFLEWAETQPHKHPEGIQTSVPPDWIKEQMLNESIWVSIQFPNIKLIRRLEGMNLVTLHER